MTLPRTSPRTRFRYKWVSDCSCDLKPPSPRTITPFPCRVRHSPPRRPSSHPQPWAALHAAALHAGVGFLHALELHGHREVDPGACQNGHQLQAKLLQSIRVAGRGHGQVAVWQGLCHRERSAILAADSVCIVGRCDAGSVCGLFDSQDPARPNPPSSSQRQRPTHTSLRGGIGSCSFSRAMAKSATRCSPRNTFFELADISLRHSLHGTDRYTHTWGVVERGVFSP